MKQKQNSFEFPLTRLPKTRPAAISVFILFSIICACVCAPLLTPYDYSTVDLSICGQAPSWDHPLGTDALGRDMVSRLLYGGRMTLKITFGALFLGSGIGSLIGLLSGFCGGWIDTLLMRLMDILSSIPAVLFAIAIEYALGWGQGNFMYAIAIAIVPSFSKVIRASAMNIRSSEYIEAARALGIHPILIIFRHVLRNISAPLLVQLSASASDVLIMCTLLGYIGIGVEPPTPEWGSLAAQEYDAIRVFPLRALLPCLAITLCSMSMNTLANELRDLFDTQQAQSL